MRVMIMSLAMVEWGQSHVPRVGQVEDLMSNECKNLVYTRVYTRGKVPGDNIENHILKVELQHLSFSSC